MTKKLKVAKPTPKQIQEVAETTRENCINYAKKRMDMLNTELDQWSNLLFNLERDK